MNRMNCSRVNPLESKLEYDVEYLILEMESLKGPSITWNSMAQEALLIYNFTLMDPPDVDNGLSDSVRKFLNNSFKGCHAS